ncbi:MAG: hypothetical protein J0I21_02435 [Alphaproteobacteria bacterium]|nr:hypothetical protein [Alphaproteobacteria bacterium]
MPNISYSTDCEAAPPRVQRLLDPAGAIAAAALLLLWPAAINHYPLVFADTGTYVSQAVERYLGWDRPVFYSFFLLLLHWQLTLWPAIVVQALLAAHTLYLALRAFASNRRLWVVPAVAGVLSATTALPWVAAQITPDLATALLPLVLALLVIVPERLGAGERWWLAAFATGLIVVHLSNVILAPLLLVGLLPLRRILGATARLGAAGLLRAGGPWLLALLALSTVNLIGHGRFVPAPYGNIFYLARSIYDGPARMVLERDCAAAGWHVCAVLRAPLPANADDLLWDFDGPLWRDEGTPAALSAEAGQIIRRAIAEDPREIVGAALANMVMQLRQFTAGDGLSAWPHTVTPVIRRDFPPAEAARYEAALQTLDRLHIPRWLEHVHFAVFVAGLAALLITLTFCLRNRDPLAGLCVAALICLLGNAAITGALSGPHDRYQARVVWLAPFAALAAVAALGRSRSGISPLPGRASVSVPAASA